MVESLQSVVWSLRRYWVSTPSPSRAGSRFVFRSPVMFLQEQGALIYETQPVGNGKTKMVRPRGEPVVQRVHRDRATGRESAERQPLTRRESRSHLYYALEDKDSQEIVIDNQLSFELEGAGAAASPGCKIVARTKTPLFEYVPPRGRSIRPRT